MTKKLCLALFLALAGAMLSADASLQEDMSVYTKNNCVSCHAGIEPIDLSNRYMDWRASVHRKGGVGCEKCHGGDPAAQKKEKAHIGVLPASDLKSRLHQWNLADTCGSCHKAVVASFVESAHYQRLKSAGMGPACNTCHTHMASAVIYSSEELSRLCDHCHNTINGLIPRRADISQRAKTSLEAIKRNDYMVDWVSMLIEDGRKRNIDLMIEADEMKTILALVKEVRTDWHTFELERVREKADMVFEKAKSLKNKLMKKLGYAM